jgi:hypothetical protein
MRKNDLIKMLTELEGNPEVVLWNGMVGDYMHIDSKFIEGSLVRMTFENYMKQCQFEEGRHQNNMNFQFTPEEVKELKNSYKRYVDWEDDAYVTDKDIAEKRYSSKRVVYINSKPRGITS